MLFFHFDSNSRVCINGNNENKENKRRSNGKRDNQRMYKNGKKKSNWTIESGLCVGSVFTVEMDTWLSCHIWKKLLHITCMLSKHCFLFLYFSLSSITPRWNWHIDICSIHTTSLINSKILFFEMLLEKSAQIDTEKE